VCGSVEHYRLLSVSKLKRSPTLASSNVAQAASSASNSQAAVQHWPAALTPCSSSMYCTAMHCSAIFRRQGVVGRSVCMYACRRKHRHTCTHKHTHTHIAAPIRQLDVHPGISYMDRQVPSCATLPLQLRATCTSTLIAPPRLFIVGQGHILGSESARRHMRRDRPPYPRPICS
jgi:hypothetical protein